VTAKTGSRLLPTLAVLASMLLWGLSFVSSKAVLNTGFPPATMVALRFLIATALLLPLRRRLEPGIRLASLSRRQRWLLLASGFTGVTVYFFFESRGIKLTSASNAALIIAAIPIVTVLAERLVFRTAIRWLQVAGILLSIVGVYFIVRRSPEHFPRGLAGNLFMLGACLSWVGYVVLSRDLHEPLAGLSLTAYQAAVGAVTLLPLALSEIGSWRLPSLGVWLNLLYLGIFCSGFAYFSYMFALARLGPVRTASFTNLIPFIGALGGMLLLGEKLSWIQLAGGLAVIGGVFLVNRRPATG
jgi:drug/metabolite transporter (DMT)-like permease